ncbi:Ribosomal RNA small subunit methyltransferase H [Euphorbia peplus]|nr:Ribosomal RNA small subunit methyltransferase H [Euphorbia peplus]
MAKQLTRHFFAIPLLTRVLLPPPRIRITINRSLATSADNAISNASDSMKKEKRKKKEKKKQESVEKRKAELLAAKKEKEKRRTRSEREFGGSECFQFGDNENNHVPVMLGEVVDVFASVNLKSFVDCTLGAAGHSSVIIKAHPELENYVGLDVDPVAHEKAQAQIDSLLNSHPHLKAHTAVRNFKHIKSLLAEVDSSLLHSGVNAILMDLGMSSMQVNNPERGFSVLANGPLDMRMDPQATLKAKDILNSWPEAEVGRILREYGEESNWHFLQKKIVQARVGGGLHLTGDLVNLIRSTTHGARGGRQGWIKTATRVFQGLRIAVNDELGTLEKSLQTCFDCLAPGGRLAVISFHSLEDRIVKKTFLNIVETNKENAIERGGLKDVIKDEEDENDKKETWIKSTVDGQNGRILTKRPITPSEEEEKLNRRSRSAKLRVIEKASQ